MGRLRGGDRGFGWVAFDRSAPWWGLLVAAAGVAGTAALSTNLLASLAASLIAVAAVRLRAKQRPAGHID